MTDNSEKVSPVNSILLNSEERLRLLEENITDYVIFTMDGSGAVSSWNEGARRILGYEEAEVLGQSGSIFFTPEDRARGADEREMRIAAAEGRAINERWHVRKAGSRFWGSGILNALRDPDGRLQGYAKIMRDLTERTLHEQHIEALNERLQQAMTETHHRVKNNLQVITAMIDLSLAHGDLIPASELRRLSAQIRALAAVHDLLTADTKGGGEAAFLSVKTMLGKLLPLIQSTSGIEQITQEIEEATISSKKGTALVLLVNELISNAVKHGKGAIRVKFQARDGTATLSVGDNGPGFPEGFDPKTAAHTGLELVENLGRWDLRGDVRYKNLPEGGAYIRVVFPLSEGAPEPGSHESGNSLPLRDNAMSASADTTLPTPG